MMQVWADYLDELRAGRTVLPDEFVERLRDKALVTRVDPTRLA
jgi:hypothetical protein